MTTQPPRDTVEPDMSWIDIAVCRNATVIVRFSPGWAEFIDEFHFEDVFECDVPDLVAGLYRWTGYKIGFWGEDDHINLKGGTFTPYALTTQSPSSEYARGIEDAAKVADDYAHEREGSWSGDAAEEVAAAIRALSSTPAQPQEGVVPDGCNGDLIKRLLAAKVFLADRMIEIPEVMRDEIIVALAAAPKEASKIATSADLIALGDRHADAVNDEGGGRGA